MAQVGKLGTQNVFFNNFENSQEQRLIEDLTIESIGIYGIQAYYIPKTYGDYDYLYGEDDLGTFEDYYTIPMYINNVEGFGGEGDFLSKFGVEQRDTMTMSVARWTFEHEVINKSTVDNLYRPREGDVIYFPLNKKLYTINFVEHEPVFYQMGALQFYELSLDMFEYSGERFNTGLEDIDKLQTKRSTDIWMQSQLLMDNDRDPTQTSLGYDDVPLPLHIETGERILLSGYEDTEVDVDDVMDSEDTYIEQQADNFIDFSDADPFSEGGTF